MFLYILLGFFLFLIFFSFMGFLKMYSVKRKYKAQRKTVYYQKASQFDSLLKKFFKHYIENNGKEFLIKNANKKIKTRLFPFFFTFEELELEKNKHLKLKQIQKKYFINKYLDAEKVLLIKCYELVEKNFTVDFNQLITIYTNFLNKISQKFYSVFTEKVLPSYLEDQKLLEWFVESEEFNQILQVELSEALTKINGLFDYSNNYGFHQQTNQRQEYNQGQQNNYQKQSNFYVDNKLENSYKILEVDSSVSDEQLKRQYQKLAKKYHPDINKDPNAGQKMAAINEAYDYVREKRNK